jgi:RNA-binding protein
MRRVGTVVRAAQHLAIVRLPEGGDDAPDVGTEVVDESLSTVGRVVDVFGPVDRPYVAVSPSEGVGAAELLGEKLYAR